jgi:predicted RNA-binding protein with PIN domain
VLYLFDGYNLLNAGSFRNRAELVDRLAGFLALRGARGIVVFDGVGDDAEHGPLAVRFAAHADDALERLAVEHRSSTEVIVVSSDRAIRTTTGQEVTKRAANEFLRELADDAGTMRTGSSPASRIEDALDEATRQKLERWRRKRA